MRENRVYQGYFGWLTEKAANPVKIGVG